MPQAKSVSRGFTLIELLVVIAIIGILSAVVLGSLALGRLRAQDATIKADLHTIQQNMEIIYSNNGGNYGASVALPAAPQSSIVGSTVFNTDPTIKGALVGAFTQSGGTSLYYGVYTGGTSYAVAVPLKADSGYWWCVDAQGSPKREPAASMTGSALSSTGTSASCP